MGVTTVEAQKMYRDALSGAHTAIDLMDAEFKRDEPLHAVLMHYRERLDGHVRDMAAANALVRELLSREWGEE